MKKTQRRWTEEEDNLLKEFAGILATKEIACQLDRSVFSVKMRAYLLRISLAFARSANQRWTVKEDALLRGLAGILETKEIMCRLNRSYDSVSSRAYALGISLSYANRAWSKEEIRILHQLGPMCTVQEMEQHLPQYTNRGIYMMSRREGIQLRDGRKKWSEEETKILHQLGPTHTAQEMIHFLPHRARQGIYLKAKKESVQLKAGKRGPRSKAMVEIHP